MCWKKWRESLIIILLVVGGDQSFHLLGRALLFSPWAASGDTIVSQDLFWVTGRKPDVVLMGDSRTGNGLKPDTIEKILAHNGQQATVVNIWVAGAGPLENQRIIKNLLLKHRPRLIICNVNENSLTVESLDESSPLIDWNRWETLMESFDWQLREAVGTLHWGSFIQRALYNATFDAARTILYGQKLPKGGLGQRRGYMPRYGRDRPAKLEAQAAIDKKRYSQYRITEYSKRRFKELLEVVQVNHLPLIITILPVSIDLRARIPSEHYKSFTKFVEESSISYGIPLCNYYADPRLPMETFFDYHHMNDTGAEMFSSFLAEEVILPALKDWEHFKRVTIKDSGIPYVVSDITS